MAILNFKGKTFVQNHHLSVKYHQLVPKRNKSLTDKVSLNDNLIIHGDNLKALKALLPTYAGKVKCIYIDPPYNTGNERWAYNDNVNSPMMQEWLGKVVDKEDFTRHDKWLCMMMPRLKLLREILSEDGIIFISIDDNEVHHLRMLMDEVCQENFVAQVIWRSKGGSGTDPRYMTIETEYILVYAKNKNNLNLNRYIADTSDYKLEDEYVKTRGKYKLNKLDRKSLGYVESLDFPIEHNGLVALPGGKENYKKIWRWRWSKEKVERGLKNGFVILKKDSNGEVNAYYKIYEFCDNEGNPIIRQYPYNNLIPEEITTVAGTNEIEQIFSKRIFEYPKSSLLIKHLLKIATDKDSIILDSFAGSGTTAHAVLDLNKEDGGNRKFILVECEDYADSITAERVRRVIKGYKKRDSSPSAQNDKQGIGGTFSYFELGDPIEMESILEGDKLPSYLELARYVFYTATGEEFDPKKVKEKSNFIGESKEYEVYLFYKPDIEYLKATALTLDVAKKLGKYKGKKRLVFAPSKYLDTDYLLQYRIDYCQLPFEIYKLRE